MKDFNDLVFGDHPADESGTQATMDFDNGYGVSVITGRMFYTSGATPYEVAVLKNGALCYDTPVTEDVIGWNTSEDVTKIMAQVQTLNQS